MAIGNLIIGKWKQGQEYQTAIKRKEQLLIAIIQNKDAVVQIVIPIQIVTILQIILFILFLEK